MPNRVTTRKRKSKRFSNSESTDSKENQIKSKPFFSTSAQNYYGSDGEVSEEAEGEEAQDLAEQRDSDSLPRASEGSNVVRYAASLAAFIVLVVFVASFTVFSISHLSPNTIDIAENVGNVVKEYKSEIVSERKFFIEQAAKSEKKLHEVLSDLKDTFETNFARIDYVDKNFKSLNQSIREVKDFVRNFSTENGKKVIIQADRKETESLKAQIKTLSAKVESLQRKSNAAGQQQGVMPEEIKNFMASIEELKSRVGNLKNKVSDNTEGNFVARSEFEEEMKKIKSWFSPKQLKRFFSEMRDGSKVDWASKSSGGLVLSTQSELKAFFGLLSPSPNTIIEPIKGPGDCLAFYPTGGSATILLRTDVIPTGFSYETVFNGSVPSQGSAPRKINVFAVTKGKTLVDLSPTKNGFDLSKNEVSQEFEFQRISEAVDTLRFEFKSNFGHEKYICIYRLRVYGEPLEQT